VGCCTLANCPRSTGRAGLIETLATLRTAGIATAGAGKDREEAERPAVIPVGNGSRVVVFSLGAESSGVDSDWAAHRHEPGVDFIAGISDRSAGRVAARVRAARQPGDLVVVSLHWGGNWGYAVAAEEVRFAHHLIEHGGVDVVHGHSSHHPRRPT
jgi:poly-gamma-glutamate synthesis protein (capsule biosynthesis protein)